MKPLFRNYIMHFNDIKIDNLIKSFGYDVKLLWKSLKIFIYMWGRVGPLSSGHGTLSLEESAFALCGFVDFFDASSTIAIIGPFPTLKSRLKSKDKKKKKKKNCENPILYPYILDLVCGWGRANFYSTPLPTIIWKKKIWFRFGGLKWSGSNTY